MNWRFSTNRRNPEYTRMDQFCPTWMEYKSRIYNAFLSELSQDGARFFAPETGERLKLIEGELLSIDIWTPLGISTCQGIVCWAHADGNEYTWGIKFTALSPNASDPLRMLLTGSEILYTL